MGIQQIQFWARYGFALCLLSVLSGTVAPRADSQVGSRQCTSPQLLALQDRPREERKKPGEYNSGHRDVEFIAGVHTCQEKPFHQFRRTLLENQKQVRRSVESLKAIRVSIPPAGDFYLSTRESTHDNPPAYSAIELVRKINLTKERLLAHLRGKRWAGLRAYASEAYPMISLSDLPTFRSAGYQDLLVSESEKAKAYEKVNAFHSKLLSLSGICVDLTITSDPAEAGVEVWADGGDPIQTRTVSKIHSIYRGKYFYKITKTDFKTVAGTIDLVDIPGILRLDCKLYSSNDREGPYPCRLGN